MNILSALHSGLCKIYVCGYFLIITRHFFSYESIVLLYTELKSCMYHPAYTSNFMYLRRDLFVTRWDDESNEVMNERHSMGACVSGVKCGVVEHVQWNTLRWFGHCKRMKCEEFVKKVCLCDIKYPNIRGSPIG